MPDLERLQDELQRLDQEIAHQNQLRDSGSDDYDFDALDRAFNRRNEVRRGISDAGGSPDGTPPDANPPQGTGGGSTDPTPTTPRTPSESTIDQLRQDLDTLSGNPPHPSVRLEDGHVVGGTEAEFEEQLAWRSRVDQLQHELTGAEADEAWGAAGGPDGFTDADLAAIERSSEKIDEIQTRLDAVNAEIDEVQARLDEAAGVLRSQGIQGGGPTAQSAAATAVGARLQGDMRALHRRQAVIIRELQAALEELAHIIRGRVRTQLEAGGVGVDLPGDPKGKLAVEESFLRRVYRRLGLPYLPVGAAGLLHGLLGSQGSRPNRKAALLALVALFLLLAVGSVAVLALGGDDDATIESVAVTANTPAKKIDSPAVSSPVDDSVAVTADSDESGLAVATEPDVIVEVGPPPTASAIWIAATCPSVFHTPLEAFALSLSYFEVAVLVGGLGGPIPPGSTLLIDAGGLSANSAPIDEMTSVVPIPIDHFGTYTVESVTVETPDGPLAVTAEIDDIIVGGAEGPIGGCRPPADVFNDGIDLIGGLPDDVWFGDEPPSGSGSLPFGVIPANEPDFDGFIDDFGKAHAARDADALLGSLDTESIDRYGTNQCRDYLGTVAGSLVDPVLQSAEPVPWAYDTDGRATDITDAWALGIAAVLGGDPVEITMHVRSGPGEITWFTDCGDPLP